MRRAKRRGLLWAWLALNLASFPGLPVALGAWAAFAQAETAEDARQLESTGREQEAYVLTQGDSTAIPLAGALSFGLGAIVVLNAGLLAAVLLRRALVRWTRSPGVN